MTIRWQTLITEKDGRIDLHKVRKLSAIAGFWLAVVVLLVGVFVQAPIDKLALISAALVAPITGASIAEGLSGKRHSEKIQAGKAPGRRSADGELDHRNFLDDEPGIKT